jgi:hypothetical protein
MNTKKNNSWLIAFALFFTFESAVNVVSAQARIVVNNNAYVVLSGGSSATPVYVVLDNPNANALTTAGAGGNWISENEYNRLRWRIGTSTGDYRVPFTTSIVHPLYHPAGSNHKIPYRLNVTSAGTGAGFVDFSTYPTTNHLNTTYPSLVTNMLDAETGTLDASAWAIDRFWVVSAQGYTLRPSGTMDFGYNPAEKMGSNDVELQTGIMVAQRYNNPTSRWIVSGGVDNAASSVTGVTVPASEFMKDWTLVVDINPLPVQLIYFNAQCDENAVLLQWATATEQNSNYFVVEKSTNGWEWNAIQQIAAAGISSTTQTYTVRDYNPSNSMAYYRLRQMDFDGQEELFTMQSVPACGDLQPSISLLQQGNGQYQLNIYTDEAQQVEFNLLDMSGKQATANRTIDLVQGGNVFLFDDSQLAQAMYILQLRGKSVQFSDKLIIQK